MHSLPVFVPVVGTRWEKRSLGFTDGHWVPWFWFIKIWHHGHEEFWDYEVEFVTDNVKGIFVLITVILKSENGVISIFMSFVLRICRA